mgnify:CR=1 FL=1
MSNALEVDICNACHPFFTGEEKFVDTQGRVDKFMKKMEVAKAKQAQNKSKKKSTKKEDNEESKTYQQLLAEQKVNLKKEEKAEAKTEA